MQTNVQEWFIRFNYILLFISSVFISLTRPALLQTFMSLILTLSISFIKEARLNISRPELTKFLKIKYEIYKKNIVFCSNMNTVNSFLNVNKSKNTENIYV